MPEPRRVGTALDTAGTAGSEMMIDMRIFRFEERKPCPHASGLESNNIIATPTQRQICVSSIGFDSFSESREDCQSAPGLRSVHFNRVDRATGNGHAFCWRSK